MWMVFAFLSVKVYLDITLHGREYTCILPDSKLVKMSVSDPLLKKLKGA